jgi:hypothetical protein
MQKDDTPTAAVTVAEEDGADLEETEHRNRNRCILIVHPTLGISMQTLHP